MRRLLRLLVLTLDGLLAGLFLVGYVARYVHPRYLWWAEVVAVGLPYVSLLLLGMTAVMIWQRAWRLVALHGVLIVLMVVRFAVPVALVPAATADATDTFTLMTFNVPHLGALDPEVKAQRMQALVAREQPDLISAQEAPVKYRRNRGPAEHLVPLLDEMDYQTSPIKGDDPWMTDQPVLARLPLGPHRQVVLPRERGELLPTRIVRVPFEWEGREAVLYNLHLHSFGQAKPWEDRQGSLFAPDFWHTYVTRYRDAYHIRAWEAEQVLALLEAETRPVIITGDLNSTMHNWAYQRLAEGRQDAFLVAGRGWGATYHAQRPLVRIDFVLADPAFEVVSAHVPDVELSDHRPLVTQLRWRD